MDESKEIKDVKSKDLVAGEPTLGQIKNELLGASHSRFGKMTIMANEELSTGVVHTMPDDLRKAITSTPKARAVWEDITPLARNEWICWVTSGKKAETRSIRIEKALSKLKGRMRRPCCWAGCSHR